MYVETDFFLALIKNNDRLKANAEKYYHKFKNKMWTSFLTMIELMLWAYSHKKDPLPFVEGAFGLVKLKKTEIPFEKLLAACYLIEKYSCTTFDSLHATICGEDEILSSDRKYDKMGLKRIKLEKNPK